MWEPGSHIWWRYSDLSVRPMTVVRDDAEGLVAWLAPGTPLLRPVLADGSEIRAAPLAQRFRLPRRRAVGCWHGQGVLKIAPPGRPWSVWLFWTDDWELRGWYVNLEDPHVRDGRWLRTRDHVLDVWVDTGRVAHLKDDDELQACVEAGRFTPAQAAGFHERAAEVRELVAAWASPFRDGWEHWRPDPSWARRLPALPTEEERARAAITDVPGGADLAGRPAPGAGQRRSGGTS